MLKNVKTSRIIIAASILLVLTAITVTATRTTQFAFIDSVKEFFGMASVTTPTRTPAPMRQLAETTNLLSPAPQPMFISTTLVVNEIDYDQVGTDNAEFVELKNVSASPINLDNYEVVFVNGAGAAIYDTIDLPNVNLAPGDYYVICANVATVLNCDLDDGPDTDFIQNGTSDAVAVRLSSGIVVDTVSYEGNAGAPYTEGTGASANDSNTVGFIGLSRFADGTDTDNNDADVSLRCISPGLGNSPATTGCTAPASFAPSISKSFATSPINVGGTSQLSIAVTNPNSSTQLTGVAFTDALPAGLTAPNASFSQCGGTLTIASNVITLSGATIGFSSTCTTFVTVTANGAATGVLTNTTSTVTSTNGGTGNSASANITINIPQYVLTVTRNGTGGGAVLSDLGVIVCPGICSDTYNAGTVVTLTASPNGGSVFAGWSGTAGCSGTGSCVTTMDAAKTATATFNVAPPTITSLNPASGWTDTTVIIVGTNFTGATAVSFGGTPATAFTVQTDAFISATAPAHAAGVVDVTVTGPGGTSANTSADDFTYVTPNTPPSVAVNAGSKIFIARYNTANFIARANVDGTDLDLSKFPIPGSAIGVTVDTVNGKLYWSSFATGGIGRMNLDGSGVEPNFLPGPLPIGMAVDTTNGWLYLADAAVKRVRLDGTGLETIVPGLNIGGVAACSGIALDVPNNKLYYAFNTAIGRANLDGTGNNQNFIVHGGGAPSDDVAIDRTNNKLYWTVSGGNKIGRANVDGTSLESAWLSVAGPRSLIVDPQASKIFWSDGSGVGRANLDGTGVNSSFLTGVSGSWGIALGDVDVEGTQATRTGTYSDVDGNNTVTLTVSAGPGTVQKDVPSAGQWTWTYTPPDGPVSPNVTIQADDGSGGITTTSFSLNVNDVSPTIALTGNSTATAGSSYTLDLGAITDPGIDTVTDYAINWGDGNTDTFAADHPSGDTRSHTYTATGNKTISVSLTDEDGTHLSAGVKTITVGAPAPVVTSLNPTSGTTLGGESVTITGTNLTGASAVSFGSDPGTSVVVVNDTTVTVVAPAHAVGVVDVIVTTLGGNSANTAADDYTYVPPVCPAGQYFNGSACVFADPGYYVPTFGQTSQTPCAAGTFQPDSGAISCNDATPGHFVSGMAQIAQTPCSPGKYQPGTAATSCIDADMGYFVANPGQELQTKCVAGRYQPNTGQTSCLLAPAGSYVPIAGSASATPCAAGFFQPIEGAISCNPADAGTFISGTGSTTAGTPCALGTYQPSTGQSACLPADPGNIVSTLGAIAQTQCVAGSYQPAPGQSSCLLSDAGSFVAGSGSQEQTACSAGFYQPNQGATSCIPAAAGTFISGTGSTTAGTPCLAGTYQPNSGQSSCLNADPGNYVPNAGGTGQIQCDPGTYQPNAGAQSCLLADANFYVPTSGATTQTPCAPGYTSGPGATACFAVPETHAEVTVGSLTVTDINGGTSNDNVTVSCNTGNLIINDPGNPISAGAGVTVIDANTVSVPIGSIFGQVVFDMLAGNDTLTVDLSGCVVLPSGGIQYAGGAGTSDSLVLQGTTALVEHGFSGSDAGTVFTLPGIVGYNGVEGLTDAIVASTRSITLPAGPSSPILDDDGTPGNGLSRITGATIPTLTFANPSTAFDVHRGNAGDTLGVTSLPDLTCAQSYGTDTDPLNVVNVSGAVSAVAMNFSADTVVTTVASSLVTTSGVSVHTTGTLSVMAGVMAGAGSFTVDGGGTVVVAGTNTFTGGVVILGGSVVSVSSDLNLGAAPSVYIPGYVQIVESTLLVTSSFTLDPERGMFVGGTSGVSYGTVSVIPGVVFVVGSIFEDNGTSTSGIFVTGGGTFVVTGVNLYSGSTVIVDSTVQVSSDVNLGTAPLVFTAGHLIIDGGTLYVTSTFTVDANRGILVGDAVVAGSGAFWVESGVVLTVASVISDNGTGDDGVVKVGPGELKLDGANTYTGPTEVNQGTLNVVGSTTSNTEVNSGSTLSGTGDVSGTVTTSSAIISPGTSPGILSTDSVIFDSASTFTAEIGGVTPGNAATNHDQLNVSGTVNLGGATLALGQFNGFVPTNGQQFVIINNDSNDAVTGTFNGLAQGAPITNFLGSGLTSTISYSGGSGNDVVLTVYAPPTISVTGGPLDFGNVTVGNTSAPLSYVVSAANLTDNLNIIAPAGFEVSLNSGDGYGGSVTIVPPGIVIRPSEDGKGASAPSGTPNGTVVPTNIYVRFVPTSAITYSDVVSNTSTGASTQNVDVTGTGDAAVCTAPPAGMVLWHSAENNALDNTASGNNGSAGTGVTYVPGKVGQAYNFNGASNGTVIVPDSASLDVTTHFTFDAWVNPSVVYSGGLNSGAVISKVGGGVNNGYQFGITGNGTINNQVFCQFNAASESWPTNVLNATVPGGIPLGAWTHIACTYDNNNLMAYVNGVLVGTQNIGPKSVVNSVSNLRISGDDNLNVFFNGQIDEPEVFNVALDATQIEALYDAGSAGKCPITPTADTDVTIASGALTIEDVNGANTDDNLTLSCVSNNLRIFDPTHTINAGGAGTQVTPNTVDVPLASVTSILVKSLAGNDALTVDLSGCDIVPSGGITFNGGDPTSGTGDRLNIVGGNQGQVTYHYTNASDGNVQMQNFGTVNYTGLEPISNTGTASDVIFELPAGANAATLGDDGTGGNGMSRLSGSTFEDTDFANPTGSVTIKRGDATDTVAVNALPDFDAGLTIGATGTEFATITFNGPVTLAAGKSLAGFATGTISMPGTNSDIATSGLGAISLTTATNVSMLSGSSLTTFDGALTINANQQVTPTTGNFNGINIFAATVQSTGTGIVTVNGKGGTVGGGQHGVLVISGGLIRGGNAAGITTSVNGTGGAATGASNIGVVVIDGGASITSIGGNVSVTGTGGSGTGGDHHGVRVFNSASPASISAGSGGTVTVSGTGGSAAAGGCFGVDVRSAGATITSSGGAVSVTGQGGACAQNVGVVVTSASIQSGTNGPISVTGTGGTAAGTNNDGINMNGGTISATGTGTVTVEGTATFGTSSEGIDLAAGSPSIATSLNSAITMIGDSMNFGVGTVNAGSGPVTIRQKTSGVAINLGTTGDPSAGPLNLTDGELDRVTAGTLFVGNSNSGQISTTAPITHPNNLTLTTGAGITFTNPVTMALNKTLTGNALGTTTGAIAVSSALAATGTGGVLLDAVRSIAVNADISTAAGTLTLNANTANTASTGTFTGVTVTSSTVHATTTGVVTVNGRGLGGPGVNVAGGTIRGGSTGASTSVTGFGGASGGGNMHGIQSNGTITSLGGNVSVTATGGTGGNSRGIILFAGGQVSSGSGGSVTVIGTGGTGGGNNFGVHVDDIPTRITAGGTGNVIVTGAGGAGTSNGVLVGRSGAINSSGGTITVTGTAPSGGFGIAVDGSGGSGTSTVASSGNATVTLIADTMSLDQGNTSISAGSGQVNLRQETIGRQINLGAADIAGTQLGLLDLEMDRVAATSTLNIGNTDTGAVSVSDIITQTKTTNITSSVGTTVLTAGSLGIFGTVTAPTNALTANSGGTVAPGASPGVINTTGNVSLAAGSIYAVEIGGATPGNGAGFHDQLNVTGTVALGATLSLTSSGGFTPSVGQSYVIINNDSNDAITSTFAGLSNGAQINNFLGVTGLRGNIFYNAGTNSNDVVLTATCLVDPVVTNNLNNGAGSLRQAVLDACPDSTITFSGAVGPTISLSGGQITIDKNLIIDGPATPLNVQNTQAPGATSRVFLINAGITATIQDMTISGGNVTGDGGGIFNGGTTLTLSNVVITGNTASSNGGGIGALSGTINISASTIRNNTSAGGGGGIYNNSPGASYVLTNGTVIGGGVGQGNQSSGGGGIANYAGSFQITGGSISRNVATNVGGGIYAPGGSITVTGVNIESNSVTGGSNQGGALYRNGDSVVNISQSRFFGNTAGTGGAISNIFAGTTVLVENNWWGCDGFPGTAGCDTVSSTAGVVDSSPRIDLRLSASPSTIVAGGTSTLTADVIKNTDNADVNGGVAPTVLVGRTFTFAGDSHGSVDAPLAVTIPVSGVVTPKVFTPHNNSSGCGLAAPSVQLDNGNQPVSITVQCADLTMSKTNNVGGSVLAGFPWTWTLTINNIGDTSAVIPAGQMIVADNLPDGPEMTYGTPTTTLANATCAIDGSKNLTCTANAGGVAIAPNSPFTVTFSATASSAGAQVNPRLAGIATVDPSGSLVTESDEGNNNATDTVNVIANPTFSINSVSVVETNGGTTNAIFTITKTGDISQPSVVRISTQDASATDADNDYEPRSNVDVPFTATQMTETVTVTVNGDTTLEPDETFNVLLTAVSNATIGTGTGVGTILNDECTPPPAGMASWFDGSGTAPNAIDIVGPNNGTLQDGAAFGTGKVGQGFVLNGTSAYVSVPDNTANSPTNAITVDAWIKPDAVNGLRTIVSKYDSSTNQIAWEFGVRDGRLELLVQQSGLLTSPYRYSRSDLAVVPTGTYSHVAATFDISGQAIHLFVNGSEVSSTLDPGSSVLTSINDSNAPMFIGAIRDISQVSSFFSGDIDEVEIFGQALTQPQIAAIASASGGGKCHTSTIQLSSAAYSVTEGNVTVPITVTRVGAHDTPATFSFATSAGTATPGAGNDYDDLTATGVTFNPGEVSKVYNIQIHDDAIFEGPETVNLTLSGISGAGVTAGSPGTGVLTINPDGKSAPAFSINNAPPVLETNGAGTTTATFTITKLNPTELSSTVHFETNDGSATVADDDYETNSGNLVFLPMETSKDITVTINGDDTFEPDETFTVLLTPVDNATIAVGGGTGVGTILNDECTVPPDGMAAWYPAQNNANDTVGGNNGQAQNGATFAPGKVGQAFDLDGIDDEITAPNSPSVRFGTNNFTIDTWVNLDSLGDPNNPQPGQFCDPGAGCDMNLVRKAVNNGDGWSLLKQADNRFWFCLGDGCSPSAVTTVTSTTVAQTGRWYHVAAVVDNSEIAIYVNGVKEGFKPRPAITNTDSTGLSLGRFLNGKLDEVELFNRALSAGEVPAQTDRRGAACARVP
ncbi:MAG: LamG-like jellyroll fold domain-containing protein [Pyrinomonadaceae bacterium]